MFFQHLSTWILEEFFFVSSLFFLILKIATFDLDCSILVLMLQVYVDVFLMS